MNTERLSKLLHFLSTDPNDPFTIYSIGHEYMVGGKFDRAVGYFEQLRKQHPQYIGTYYHLARTYEQLQKPEQAIEVYHAGIDKATEIKDHHALGELKAALSNLDPEYDDGEEW